MMRRLTLSCLLFVLGQSQVTADECQVDNSICTNSDPPKLGVAYNGNNIACNALLKISDVIQKPELTFSQGKEGERYVLVFFDPDAPYPCAHSDGSSFLHYAAVFTLTDGQLREKVELVSYEGPHPPLAIHRYQFYLFLWTHNDPPAIDNTDQQRGSFKLDQFKTENSLDTAAVFQFRVPHE